MRNDMCSLLIRTLVSVKVVAFHSFLQTILYNIYDPGSFFKAGGVGGLCVDRVGYRCVNKTNKDRRPLDILRH